MTTLSEEDHEVPNTVAETLAASIVTRDYRLKTSSLCAISVVFVTEIVPAPCYVFCFKYIFNFADSFQVNRVVKQNNE